MEQNIVRIIFNALNTFKENDEIFQYLYNYKDTIPNFSFLEDCLNTLIIILENLISVKHIYIKKGMIGFLQVD